MPDRKVVTRFAPSPTGALHVGGARTALFNWAFARQHGGTFILRLEDTDQARSSEVSAKTIMADMLWLGMEWDEGPAPDAAQYLTSQKGVHGPYCQSQRLEIYNSHLEKLLSTGRAFEKEGAVVFRMPAHDITVKDLILGDVKTAAGEMKDLVVRKSDGFPTFHFANVIDDATMGVTHVIRAQEHLNNTHKHLALFEALGLEPPRYAHIPLIFNPDGTKMSKRDKAKAARAHLKNLTQEKINEVTHYILNDQAVGKGIGILANITITQQDIEDFIAKKSDRADIAQDIAAQLGISLPEIEVSEFRTSGYLPQVLCNYLSLLGWNPGNDVEKFDNEFLVEHFSFDRVGKGNAKFDREKLFRFNADAVKAMAPAEFVKTWQKYCKEFKPNFAAKLNAKAFETLAEVYQPRTRTLDEPCKLATFFVTPDNDIVHDPQAVAKELEKDGGQGYKLLRELKQRLETIEPWSGAAAHDLIRVMAEEKSLGMGKLAQPLRVAVSGSTVTPQIDATLDILGKQSTLNRIERLLSSHGH